MDDRGRPRVLLLSAGNTNDITMAHALIEAAGPFQSLLADRGYDADHLRKRLAERNAEAVIPTTTSRKRPIPYDTVAYRQRNTVERLWGEAQGLPKGRHALRQTRRKLPLRRPHCCNYQLLGQMSPDPRANRHWACRRPAGRRAAANPGEAPQALKTLFH